MGEFLRQRVMRVWSIGGASWQPRGRRRPTVIQTCARPEGTARRELPLPKSAPCRYIDKQRLHRGIIVMVIVGTIDEADELFEGGEDGERRLYVREIGSNPPNQMTIS